MKNKLIIFTISFAFTSSLWAEEADVVSIQRYEASDEITQSKKPEVYFIKIKGYEVAKVAINRVTFSRELIVFWKGESVALSCNAKDLEYALKEGVREIGAEYLKRESHSANK